MNLTSPCFDRHELELVERCLESGWVTLGPFSNEFERLFAERHQLKHAFCVNSCTSALHLACMALGLGPGDEVVVPAFTWVTSAHCVEYVGAKPVFADVDIRTFNLDPAALDAAITPRTRAVVVVHLFGLPVELDAIFEICRRHGLAIIEDAACAAGATYEGRPVGAFGEFGCFSFHPRKVITTGEGGMVTTNSDRLAKKIVSLRSHGATGLPPGASPAAHVMATFNMLGYNYRMSDIQAAVGVAQMAKLDALLEERLARATRYNRLLRPLEGIALPHVPPKCGHTYQSYVIRIKEGGLERRNKMMDDLSANEIQTRPGTHAVHRLGYYRDKYHFAPDDLPNASLCEDTSITLPIFPGMTTKQQEFVVESLATALR